MPDMNLFLIALAVLIIFGIYMAGYNLIFSHNAFDKDNPQGIMPEIDIKPFKVFWNALPLMICWTFYIFTSVILSCFIIATNTFMKIFGIALLLFVLMFCAFAQFVYIEYSKNYDKNGDLKSVFFVDKNGKETPVDINNPRTDKFYKTALTDYYAEGHDGFTMLKKDDNDVKIYDFDVCKCIEDYMRKNPQPVDIKDDGRIQIVD